MYNINPDAGKEQHLSQLEKMEKDLEQKLSSAKTADFGNLNSENAQKLQKIIEENQPPPVEIEKMTGEEAEAGRQAHIRGNSADAQQKRKIAGFLGWLGSTVEGMFAKTEKRKTQCELYGHDLPTSGKWDGQYPECPRCGVKITSQDMLRKAVSPHNVDHS